MFTAMTLEFMTVYMAADAELVKTMTFLRAGAFGSRNIRAPFLLF